VADILGYARVSTQQQDLELQKHRLQEAGVIKIFEDVIAAKSLTGLD
jgi:DNA invertase Pin-like site-specific DNA recombinase